MQKNNLYTLLYSLLFLLASPLSADAKETSIGGIIKDESGETIIGANLILLKSKSGAISDLNGKFKIVLKQNSDHLVVSYVGYNSDTIAVNETTQPLTIILKESIELKELVVNGTQATTIKNRNSLIQTEQIGYTELCRAACCNLSESFETNPSVDVSFSDAATGAKQIRMLGLPGTYVQMLAENIPNFRGAAAQFGMDYVPAPWMESIQVSKGAASVRTGYESVTGQINIEYKKPPTADPLTVNLFGASSGRIEGNVDGNIHLNKYLSTGLFVHYSQDKFSHDGNGDGFLDLPLLEQANVFNRWYYKKGHFISQIGGKFIYETRDNGQISNNQTSEETLYKIGIATRRGELFTKNGYVLDESNNRSIALIVSSSYHEQDSKYGSAAYNLSQTNLYANLMYDGEINKTNKISAGLSLNMDRSGQYLNMKSTNPEGNHTANDLRNEWVSGGFAEYTWTPAKQFTLQGGIRGDHHNEYGFFVTPRLHAKYNPIEQIHLRASIGKGFRSVNPIIENNFLFASNRINALHIAPNLTMEEALNYGASLTGYIPIGGKELIITGEYYQTDFLNQVVTDLVSNPHGVSFYNLDGRSYARNYQIEASYPLFKGFDLKASWRWTDAKTTYNGILKEKPLVNRYKGLITASYSTPLKKWQFDATAQFNGAGSMPTPDATNPLWEKEFKPYTIVGAQVTKYFKNWSIYLGSENLLNFKQPNPIIDAANPWGDNFDATMVWGPIHGRKIYGGVRWNIPKID